MADSSITPVPCALPGKRSYNIRGSSFTVDARYHLIKPVGVGAYGLVVSALDKASGEKVAIKKVANALDDLTDAKRVLREIRLMQAMQHDNILPLTDIDSSDPPHALNDIYLTTPLYDKDLSKILAAKVKLTTSHIQYFIYQMLCALKYMHSANILHRDLKPANILVQESCDLALCDFGLARYFDEQDPSRNDMTEYVVTRWYRAPELVLTHSYTSAVDLWAVGCILGELLAGGQVLFPGNDFKHQVETICAVLGKPSMDDCKHVTSARARRFLEGLPEGDGTLKERFEGVDEDGVDLMTKLLKFNPSERLTATQALAHPFVKSFHDEEFETCAAAGGIGELEPGGEVGKEELMKMMWEEVYKFRPELR